MSDPEIFIERCPHDKENPYVMTSRDLIRDESLTMQCRWMLIYLLSHTGKWKISVRQIWNHCKQHRGGGRDSVRSWVKEAIEAGYMACEEYLNENNLRRVKYYLSETPKFKKSLPRPGNQEPDCKGPADHTYKKEHLPSEVKKEHMKKESSHARAKESAAAAKPSARIARATHVSTSVKEHEELVKAFGEEMVQRSYERLSEWKDDTPKSKWKKNDHLAIRRWVVDALTEADIRAQKASKSSPDRIKQAQEYIVNHPKKEVLRRAANANLIKIEGTHIVRLGQMGGNATISFDSPGILEKIDSLIGKLEGRLR